MKRFDLSLYLVLDPGLCRVHDMVETARLAVLGGATMVQLRDKQAGTAGLIATGRALMSAMAGSNVPVVVNDDVEAACAIGAHGIHVGQDDLPARLVRQRVGPDMIVGLSAECESAVRDAEAGIVDYLGLGPVFATPTKADHKTPIGTDGLTRLARISPVPSVAIGGIKLDQVALVLRSGVDGLSVVSAICGQSDPKAAAELLSSAIRAHRSV
ncbi:MAG: thiamine phosphate synthase [Rhizobiaceae bacterium]|nr:thiamine phosphate synthase [Rhizobiaceae bacterium]